MRVSRETAELWKTHLSLNFSREERRINERVDMKGGGKEVVASRVT